MITPRPGWILLRMLPTQDDFANPLNLALVDQKKHWERKSRRGKVVAVGRGIRDLSTGDVLVIAGHAGKTLDGREVGYGEEFRWIRTSDALAIDDREKELCPS